jgi:DNA-directed RNA polymerase sigma subunit (sigma70/sigma32)
MSLHELNQKMQEATIKQIAVSHQSEAIAKLYEAATMMNNGPLMEQYRDQLHTLLDVKLDTVNEIMELSRQLIRLAGRG